MQGGYKEIKGDHQTVKHSGPRVTTSSQSSAGQPKGPDYDWLVETGLLFPN